MKSKWQKFVEGEIALRVERDDYWKFALNCENCNIMYRGGGVPVPKMNPFHIYPNKKYIIFYCVNPGYTAPWCKLVYTDVTGLKQKHGDIPIENFLPLKEFYLCDPEKNKNCTKETCYIHGGLCSLTTDPNCSYTKANGEPIKEESNNERH